MCVEALVRHVITRTINRKETMMTSTKNAETATCALRWVEINKRLELVSKEREFKSQKARERFIEKLLDSGNLYEITASLN